MMEMGVGWILQIVHLPTEDLEGGLSGEDHRKKSNKPLLLLSHEAPWAKYEGEKQSMVDLQVGEI